MFGSRFIAPRVAVLTAALLWASAAPAHAASGHGGAPHGGSGGYHGSSGGYRGNSGGYRSGYSGGYRSGYYGGYRPGYFGGLGVGLYYSPFYGADYGGAYGAAYTPPAYAYPSPSPALYSGGGEGDLGPAAPQPPGPPPPDGAAAVGVVVPADAEVWFNGDPTKQTGEQREFVTPTLPVGRAYQYEILRPLEGERQGGRSDAHRDRPLQPENGRGFHAGRADRRPHPRAAGMTFEGWLWAPCFGRQSRAPDIDFSCPFTPPLPRGGTARSAARPGAAGRSFSTKASANTLLPPRRSRARV